MNQPLQGFCVFPGLALAPVFKVAPENEKAAKPFQGVDTEIEQLHHALTRSEEQIQAIKASAAKRLSPKEAEIFEAHRMMLTDPEYIGAIEEEIRSNQKPAALAIHEVTETFIKILSAASSDYMRERVADLRDISGRFIRNLSNHETMIPEGDDFIYAGMDLAPSDLMALCERPLKGVVLAKGGSTSHTSILLKALGIPSLIGVKGLEEWLEKKSVALEWIFLNASHGSVEIDPAPERRTVFEAQVALEAKQQEALKQWKTRPSKLASGEILPLLANVGSQKQILEALTEGAEGVGLYRTEFLFLDRASAPTLEEQTEIYKQAVQALQGKTLVVRTLDIGGDKQVSYMNLPKEENPFLGVRGLRLCLEREELFQTQIRALLLASQEGPIDIMVPMVTDPEEMVRFFELIKPLRSPKDQVRWGMMLEVPQNLFMIPELSEHVSFFSVGTNDLTQYLTASDRMNPHVQHLNDSYSPGVLRALAYLAKQVKTSGRELSVCGEIGADSLLLPFLVGLGVNKLSMSARMIARQRSLLAHLDQKACEKLVPEILGCSHRSQVISKLRPLTDELGV